MLFQLRRQLLTLRASAPLPLYGLSRTRTFVTFESNEPDGTTEKSSSSHPDDSLGFSFQTAPKSPPKPSFKKTKQQESQQKQQDQPNHQRQQPRENDKNPPALHSAFKNKNSTEWRIQKDALKKKFGDQKWAPRKRLSPDTMECIRDLHKQYPNQMTTPVLAREFKVSPEAVRRILKDKWHPPESGQADRRLRWVRRGERIWGLLAEGGYKPPLKWRESLQAKGKLLKKYYPKTTSSPAQGQAPQPGSGSKP